VENNTNALRYISVAVGILNQNFLLNGVKNFNLGICKITRVCIEINEWNKHFVLKSCYVVQQ
jgi:hypothetical protein